MIWSRGLEEGGDGDGGEMERGVMRWWGWKKGQNSDLIALWAFWSMIPWVRVYN